MRARVDVLDGALAALAAEQRAAFNVGVVRLFESLTTSRDVADHIFRLCDEEACGRDHRPVKRRAVKLAGL